MRMIPLIFYSLFQESEAADDRALFCLAACNVEEHYHSEHEYDSEADDCCDRNDDRESKDSCTDHKESLNDRHLERLTHMECSIRRLRCSQKGDEYSYQSKEISAHAYYLVVGDILSLEL